MVRRLEPLQIIIHININISRENHTNEPIIKNIKRITSLTSAQTQQYQQPAAFGTNCIYLNNEYLY